MDMWTTQERCPHAHSLNNKYKSQTKVELAKDQIAHRFFGGGPKKERPRAGLAFYASNS